MKWKGDTVVQVSPNPNNARTGYSDLIKRNTSLYYSGEGPGKLYDRSHLLCESARAQRSNVNIDRTTIDWYSLVRI